MLFHVSLQVLGTPTREQIREMNPNYTEFKFPQIKAHPWTKVSQQVQQHFYFYFFSGRHIPQFLFAVFAIRSSNINPSPLHADIITSVLATRHQDFFLFFVLMLGYRSCTFDCVNANLPATLFGTPSKSAQSGWDLVTLEAITVQ